jgi:hypothetical protein
LTVISKEDLIEKREREKEKELYFTPSSPKSDCANIKN